MAFNTLSVSVIIPVYNGGKFLAEAINSILSQKHSPIEIIVIDDGSTDNTSEVAMSYGNRVHYVYQENKGAPAARNHGLRLASGNIIASLDADDIWAENKLKKQLAQSSRKNFSIGSRNRK